MRQEEEEMIRKALLIAAIAGCFAAQAAPAWALGTTVDTSADGDDGDCTAVTMDCTLREAVDVAVDGNTVTIPVGINPVLTLGQEVQILDAITIEGAGASVTTVDAIAASAQNNAFFLFDPATIKDMTITGGRAQDGDDGVLPGESGDTGESGGAIGAVAPLTLDSVTITGNHAGNGGSGANGLTGPAPTAGGNGGLGGSGGGVAGFSTMSITNSTFSDNLAGDGGAGGTGGSDPTNTVSGANGGNGGSGGTGGGVYNQDPINVTNSTINSDIAGDGGLGGAPGTSTAGIGMAGAGGPGGSGGGINIGGAAALINSTITGNLAGAGGNSGAPNPQSGGYAGPGGGISALGAFGGYHLTIAGNAIATPGTGSPVGAAGQGGGIWVSGTLRNSIVASNLNASDPTTTNCIANVLNGLHNISFAGTGCAGFATGNPLLGPLTLNAPGTTETMALGPGSTAIDQVPALGASCEATDQRGLIRPVGPACDIGAYEAPVFPAPPPPPPPDGGTTALTPTLTPATPAAPAAAKCKKPRKLRKGKCVKKKKK